MALWDRMGAIPLEGVPSLKGEKVNQSGTYTWRTI